MLKQIGKFIIYSYWRIKPKENRKVCLFNPSCSIAVYNELDKGSFIKAVKIFFFRLKHCKGGFKMENTLDGISLVSVKGYQFKEHEINPILLKEFRG